MNYVTKNSLSYARYSVRADASIEATDATVQAYRQAQEGFVLEGLNTEAFPVDKRLDANTPEAWGWVHHRDLGRVKWEDELHVDPNYRADVTMRHDKVSVPGSTVSWHAEAEFLRALANGDRSITPRKAREKVIGKLYGNAQPRSDRLDMTWYLLPHEAVTESQDPPVSRARVFGGSTKSHDHLVDLCRTSFKLSLKPLGPLELLGSLPRNPWDEDQLHQLSRCLPVDFHIPAAQRPAEGVVSAPLAQEGEDLSWFGAEWLTWLWFMSETKPHELAFDGSTFELSFERSLQLKRALPGVGGAVGQQREPDHSATVAGPQPTQTREAEVALVEGKKLVKARLRITLDEDQSFEVTVTENFTKLQINGLGDCQAPKPRMWKDDAEQAKQAFASARVLRLGQLETLENVLDALVARFAEIRVDDEAWLGEYRAMCQWVDGKRATL